MSKSASSASASAASAASAASKSMSTASAKASAAAADALHYNDGRSTGLTLLMACAIVITVSAVVLGGIYFSGYADDLMVYYAKKFYEAKAKTEMAAMEKLGEGKAQDFLKGMPLRSIFEFPSQIMACWVCADACLIDRSIEEEPGAW